MPTWTVDRNRPGLRASASAVPAPRRPAFAIAISRGSRDETIASSERANTPFNAISTSAATISANKG